MTTLLRTAQLSALDVLTIDTETTGLDAKTARIVQIAALPGVGDQVDEQGVFDSFVDPGEPIPPRSTAVHGVGDADVAGAPDAVGMFERLTPLLERRVVVGHTISYDIAILEREAETAGVGWTRPPALDVRLLARIAAPTLADYGLDSLCEWLAVENVQRHRAMGDARATQAVFAKLLPLLREKGVRTLAEAEARSARVAENANFGDYVEIPSVRQGAPASLTAGGVSDAYTTRVRDLMSAPPLRLPDDTAMWAAMAEMMGKRASSLFTDAPDGSVGILTERDVLRAVNSDGAAALDAPMSRYHCKPLITILDDAFVYRAIGRMTRRNLRHLGVRNAAGEIVGALSAR
ncbi:MAG: exonuclease domain-containing protein, partial [Pseudomonadota bacterium]